jgi:putative ABC transport system permease protein
MTFSTVVLRGLLRRPVRTGLTLAGIAVGIAAVVALVGMAWGFEKSWDKGFKARHTDVIVANLGGAFTPKAFDASVKERIAQLPRVAAASAGLSELMSVEDAPMLMVTAREWGGFTWENLKVVEGRMPLSASEPAVVLGTLAAEALKKKVGDTLQVEAKETRVVGIVDGGAVVENGAVILALALMQEITGNEGKINFVSIRVTPGTTEAETQVLCDQIRAIYPEGRAMVAGELLSSSQGFRIIQAMSWGTAFLALLVGILGVMNTMLMTVFERTHEIGILLALGWKRSRIVRMVLWESAVLGLLGGVAGVIIGAGGLKLLERTTTLRGLLEPDLSAHLLLTSVAIAVVVGVLSGLYPAWRSSRLTPSVALRT